MKDRRQYSRRRGKSSRLYCIASRAIIAERIAHTPSAAVLALHERIETIVRMTNKPVRDSHHAEWLRSGGADCLESPDATATYFLCGTLHSQYTASMLRPLLDAHFGQQIVTQSSLSMQ
jgi:hypothetical protein